MYKTHKILACMFHQKNEIKQVVIGFKDHPGGPYYDIREFFLHTTEEEFVPTKKGLMIHADKWIDFLNMVNEVER